ncbi:MAG: metallopeptidase TldD-related protein, partial [Promethearchaeota archaeon]
MDLTHLAIEEALSQGTERVAGTFFFGSTKFLLTSSTGLSGEYIRTNLNFRIRAFARDLHATGEAISCSTHMNKRFNPIEAGKEAGEIARASIGSKRGVPGTYNIIIYPKVATELQAPTPAIAMNSYVHKMGLAWLVGKKVGDQIANECISVWDDGTIPQGLRTAPFDDELVPTNRTLLIDKGKIKAFYTNTSLAKKGEKSTGNAGITMPKTLLITSTWYTRYQSYAPPGILSSLPKDGMFLIKNKGKTLEPVKELRINSDHYHLLNNTVALGK